MLPVLAHQVPIERAGDIYCIVLHHCHKVAYLIRRLQSRSKCSVFRGERSPVCDGGNIRKRHRYGGTVWLYRSEGCVSSGR